MRVGVTAERGSFRRAFVLAALVLAMAGAALPAARATDDTTSPPVLDRDFADPFVLRVGATYYAYATNAGASVPVVRSTDLAHWQPVGDALPVLPAWAAAGFTWAPSVLPRGGVFVMYYTAFDRVSARLCVSRAVSSRPEGPFVDPGARPLHCDNARGGAIDPSPFVDRKGVPYLLWKTEGKGKEPARIWIARLRDDGLALAGAATPLLRPDQPWEGAVVEGPSMVFAGGRYWLLYSANRWESAAYAVGWASCPSPTGPCTKGRGPALSSTSAMAGPGGQEVFTDRGGALRVAYHAWSPAKVGYPAGRRSLHLGRLQVSNDLSILPR